MKNLSAHQEKTIVILIYDFVIANNPDITNNTSLDEEVEILNSLRDQVKEIVSEINDRLE